MVTLPNFVVIGAPKAGTTSLHDYLRVHPDIFMSPVKGPRFFMYNGQKDSFSYPVKTVEEYEKLFDGRTSEAAIGEATAQYMEFPDVAGKMKSIIPDVKIVAILREPVQRAFSIYHMNLRDRGRNKGLDFIQALDGDHSLKKMYYEGLEPFYREFPASRIKVVLFDDLVRDTKSTIQSIYGFLGVDPDFVPERKVSNPGGIPKFKFIHDVLIDKRLRQFSRKFLPESVVGAAKDLRSANLKKHRMTDEERVRAYAYFREDILRTQSLIGMDLGAWLQPDQEGGAATAPHRRSAGARD
jgi:hypothetical protein